LRRASGEVVHRQLFFGDIQTSSRFRASGSSAKSITSPTRITLIALLFEMNDIVNFHADRARLLWIGISIIIPLLIGPSTTLPLKMRLFSSSRGRSFLHEFRHVSGLRIEKVLKKNKKTTSEKLNFFPMVLRVGRIPFLVCAPFFHEFLEKETQYSG
jgi:hypothetical protein